MKAFSLTASGTGISEQFSRDDKDPLPYRLQHWFFEIKNGEIKNWIFFTALDRDSSMDSEPPSKVPESQRFLLSSAGIGDQSRNRRKFGHTDWWAGRFTPRIPTTASPELVTVYIWDYKWPFFTADGSVGHAAIKGDDTELLSTFPKSHRMVDEMANLSMEDTLTREYNRQPSWIYRLTIADRQKFRDEIQDYMSRRIWSFYPAVGGVDTNCVDSAYHVLQYSSSLPIRIAMTLIPGPFTPAILHDELEFIMKIGGPIKRLSPAESR